MNLEKFREVFVQNRARKKNGIHFLHRFHGFREMSIASGEMSIASGELMHL